MARPKKFACLICGKRFNLKNRVLRHIFNHHLRAGRVNELFRFCWCQPVFLLEDGTFSFKGWEQHVRQAGGLQAHYTAHALNIGD